MRNSREKETSFEELWDAVQGKRAFSIEGQRFEISSRYMPIRVIGSGVYGLVISAHDAETDEFVAIKKISGLYDDLQDAKRVLREIRLMHILDHENLLSICDMEDPESLDFQEVYIYSPLYDNDLAQVIASDVALSEAHVKYFIYQLLCALQYLHSASVLHRDLKPANCLVTANCDLVVCDFGLARYVDTNDSKTNVMTEYVITRWYRPPELVLSQVYSTAVDIWGVGCILGQLLSGRPLFPGKDFKHQVEVICGVIGKPSEVQMAHITSQRARTFLQKLPIAEPLEFRRRFPAASEEALDLLEKLLKFSPTERISATEALRHPFLEEYLDPEFEGIVDPDFDLDSVEPQKPGGPELTREDFARLFVREIVQFRPKAAELLHR